MSAPEWLIPSRRVSPVGISRWAISRTCLKTGRRSTRRLPVKEGAVALTEEQEIKVPGLLSRFVRLQSGVKAHYSTSGEAGPAVVLLHGGIPGSSGSAGF